MKNKSKIYDKFNNEKDYIEFCVYGANKISPLLKEMSSEIEVIRIGNDIEGIHKMRVASRRLRAALPIFERCFSFNKFNAIKEIRNITKALGIARDTDVQIEFIKEFASTLSKKTAHLNYANVETLQNNLTKNNQLSNNAYPILLGIEYILVHLTQKRKKINPQVLYAVSQITEKNILRLMKRQCKKVLKKEKKLLKNEFSPFTYEVAQSLISKNLKNLYAYDSFVNFPNEKIKHHEMRIIAKKLRYTMELFNDLYGIEFKGLIKTIKKLQEVLGDLHDCDVWIEFLPQFIEQEKQKTKEFFGSALFFKNVEPGLIYLLNNRINQRQKLYESFINFWQIEMKDKTKKSIILNAISTPQCIYQKKLSHLIKNNKNYPLKLAFISDIHGNLNALKAVVEDAKSKGVCAILNAGDSIGDENFSESVIKYIQKENIISIIGNYDLMVLEMKHSKKPKQTPKKNERLKKPKVFDRFEGVRAIYKNLSKESRAYLNSFVSSILFTVEDKKILLTHGSPRSITEYVDANISEQRLREFIADTDADFIVTGHSHRPSIREVDGVTFINAGSVGKPRDADNRACYAILQLNPFLITHVRI
ncbi:MAG: YfcE family phosphodiesterase [Methanosarcinaceae archaeon]|nr:YfcE family phosphodiesterase [Methanosarcinaceae archaeon]